MGIRRFSDNFPKIYAKTRFSELHERASQASSTQTKQSCERSELRQHSAVFASKAQSEQIKQIKHVSCERSKLRLPSAVFANQLKQASQVLYTLAKRANQASYSRLHSRLRLPSHTGHSGREEGREDPKSFFKLAKNWICAS